MANQAVRKRILTISLSRHVTGEPVSQVIATDWKKVGTTSECFDNHGFDVNPEQLEESLHQLHRRLRDVEWDGVLVGWCLRGYPDRTPMFERIMGECIQETRQNPTMKLMFCTGPNNLAESVLRNFPQACVE